MERIDRRRIRVVRRLSALGAAVLVSMTASAQEFGPVTTGTVAGQLLTDRDANFSVRAPEGWEWLEAQVSLGRMYLCRTNESRPVFLVLTQEDGRRRMNPRAADRFIDGALGALRQQGYQVLAVERDDSVRPFDGAHRFSAMLSDDSGNSGRSFGYVGTRGRLYAMQGVVAGDAEERLFEEFAASFRLLKPVPMFPPLTIGLAVGTSALVLLGLSIAFFGCRWSQGARAVKLLIPVVGLVALTYVGVAAWAVVRGMRTVDDLDYVLGQVAGAFLIVTVGSGVAVLSQRRDGAR